MPPIEKLDATLGTLKKCKCVPPPGLRATRGAAACNPRRAALTCGAPRARRHLALSTNLIVKISNLAGLDSCAPGGRGVAPARNAPDPPRAAQA